LERIELQIDIHQHIWTEPLLDALAARESLPFVRRSDGLTVLHSAGELPYVIDEHAESPARRVNLLAADGLDRALIALSSPIGIEALARNSARELIAAHLDGVQALGDAFGAWGPLALDDPDPDDVDALLARGCVGISFPAGALAGCDALAAARPLLERIAARSVPLLVHPGPAVGEGHAAAGFGEPLWWRPLTLYVAQMKAAWLAFASRGRREHPELVAVFAMLAGGAPLFSERLSARGGPAIDLRDPLVFYDTSSYGSTAVDAMAALVGSEQLVYGSDRPVVEPLATTRDRQLRANSARLLARIGAAA
jgi:hypothetical protein